MSYILDALKKSEQERGRGDIPGVQTVHSSSLNYHGQKKTYWPYFLIAAVLLNLAAIVYFIIDKEQPGETVMTQEPPNPPATNPSAISSTETSTAISNTRQAEPVVTEHIVDKPAVDEQWDTQQSTAPVIIDTTDTGKKDIDHPNKPAPFVTQHTEPEPATSQPVVTQDKQVIEFYELPESVKQELPALIISAHVYSSNPLQRSIVINNNFMEEGEYVIDDLRLHEITPDGAIFDFRETRFHHGVVSSWQ